MVWAGWDKEGMRIGLQVGKSGGKRGWEKGEWWKESGEGGKDNYSLGKTDDVEIGKIPQRLEELTSPSPETLFMLHTTTCCRHTYNTSVCT